MMLPGMLAEPVAEDSLENTFSCVPKVQGDEPNLSGKRTENCMRVQFLCFFAVPMGAAYFIVKTQKGDIRYVRKTH